jgi:hypothetical protein
LPIRLFPVFLLLFAAAPAAHAQMYKCTDERGRTTYSDKPGPSCKGGEVDIRPSPPAGGKAAAPGGRDLAEQEAEFQRRRIQREQADEKAAAQRARMEQRCASMHTDLARLQSARRMVSVDAKGKQTVMDDAARTARAERLKAEIAKQCSQ